LNELANVLADLPPRVRGEPVYRRMLAALRTLYDADRAKPAVGRNSRRATQPRRPAAGLKKTEEAR